MLTRILAALVFTPLFLALLLFAPTLLVCAIVAVAAFELMRAVQVKNRRASAFSKYQICRIYD